MALDTRLTPRRIDALLRVALNVRRASMCRPGVRLMDKVYKTVTKSNPLKLDLAEQKMASTVYFSGGMSIDQTKLAAAQFKSDHTG